MTAERFIEDHPELFTLILCVSIIAVAWVVVTWMRRP